MQTGKIDFDPFLRDKAQISTPDEWFMIIYGENCEETIIRFLDPPEL
jgi:hypothetical protein